MTTKIVLSEREREMLSLAYRLWVDESADDEDIGEALDEVIEAYAAAWDPWDPGGPGPDYGDGDDEE